MQSTQIFASVYEYKPSTLTQVKNKKTKNHFLHYNINTQTPYNIFSLDMVSQQLKLVSFWWKIWFGKVQSTPMFTSVYNYKLSALTQLKTHFLHLNITTQTNQ